MEKNYKDFQMCAKCGDLVEECKCSERLEDDSWEQDSTSKDHCPTCGADLPPGHILKKLLKK